MEAVQKMIDLIYSPTTSDAERAEAHKVLGIVIGHAYRN